MMLLFGLFGLPSRLSFFWVWNRTGVERERATREIEGLIGYEIDGPWLLHNNSLHV